ncbi:stage III sporulation protein AF [Alkalibaculum bacchi]|uniref:Stage III sporulation protein AF n=1 Tax=Alkalibaculum bacchi TaxID=645887 RepID=A0A366I9R6_9FIRM|nr:stage III sporulation protein AF [Alkalibaculum bacchi]RBP65274.1 stage III sporulation protein AF [Alkalibaculum bacchi]
MNAFSIWLKNIVIITATVTLLHLILPKSMGKYVKIVTGFIVVLAMVQPFTNVLNTDFYLQNLMLKHDLIMKENTVSQMDPLSDEKITANEKELTVQLYKDKLSENIEQNIGENFNLKVEVNLEIYEDLNQDDFGTLKKAQVILLTEEDDSVINPVEKIEIEKDNTKETIDEKTTKDIKNFFLNFYNLKSENISISERK